MTTNADPIPGSLPDTTHVLTPRGVIAGSLLVVWINFWTSYAEYVVHASRMNISHYPVALFISYVVLAASIPAIRRLSPYLALSSADMAVTLAMGMVGAMVPTSGLMGFFLGIIATPFYFATAENRWAEFFHPHIPEWVAPRDHGHALTWFFDGPSRWCRGHPVVCLGCPYCVVVGPDRCCCLRVSCNRIDSEEALE